MFEILRIQIISRIRLMHINYCNLLTYLQHFVILKHSKQFPLVFLRQIPPLPKWWLTLNSTLSVALASAFLA